MEKQPPKQIYLQAYDSDFYDDNTWCVDRINDEDIEYILQSEYDQLKSENEKLRTIIDASKAVVTDAENQAEARLHADVENEKLRGVLREIANSAGIDGCGYTTGEGHSDCVWKARKALNEVTK